MHKRLIIVILFLGLLAPLSAKALTFEDLTARIQQLGEQITALQLQLSTMLAATGASTGAALSEDVAHCTMDAKLCPDGSYVGRVAPSCKFAPCPDEKSKKPKLQCPAILRALLPGSRGDDVRDLQRFLAESGYLSSNGVTGVYGILTQRAIEKLQKESGIVTRGDVATTGFGRVGAQTRNIIRERCKDIRKEELTSYSLSATPLTGKVPVNVTFTIKAPAGTYTLQFGDNSGGQKVTIPAIQCITTPCNPPPETLVHTYGAAGVFTAQLIDPGGCGPNADPRCLGAPSQILGTVIIKVTGTPRVESSTCTIDTQAAQKAAEGMICTQQAATLTCPYNSATTYLARNGCEINFLQNRGWTMPSGTQVIQ